MVTPKKINIKIMKIKFITFLLLLIAINATAQRTTILIIADDLSADYFGFFPGYGDTVDVPNIRYLANARGSTL